MALYRVILPYGDASPGSAVRYTTIEVEAESEQDAKRLALAEFGSMAVLGPSGGRPRVVEGEIKVERAPVARRASLEVTTTPLGPQLAAMRLVGSLNSSNFTQLQQALDELRAAGFARLVMDLSGLTYVNSTGLSLFVAAGDLFEMRLAAVPNRILRLLKMIGLDKLFQTFNTVAEAAKAFSAAPGGPPPTARAATGGHPS